MTKRAVTHATSGAEATIARFRKAVPCPKCGQPSQDAAYPFCSKRCADLDLGAWLNGSYAIPASEEEPGGDAD